MKTFLILVLCLIVAIIVLMFIRGMMSKHGTALGLTDGHLYKCADKPNCVYTEDPEDQSHYLSPISITHPASLSIIKDIIRTMGGTIQLQNDSYIAATFTSSLFRFVDDLEIRVDSEESLIHIRSASRVGYSDFGVNKKRVELLKQLYQDHLGDR